MTTDLLRQRAKALRLHGLLAHWTEIAETSWLPTLVQWEEEEQIRRSLERRLKGARLGFCHGSRSAGTGCVFRGGNAGS
jgi:hypothetical protein